MSKAMLSGPLPVEDDVAFVPKPVETATVSYYCHNFNRINMFH
jgi:hypothetical protein